MQKVKNEEHKNGNGIDHYSTFSGHPIVKFEAGFRLGKKKIAAVLANKEQLQKFIDGDFDREIDGLMEGEVLKP